LCPAPGCGRQGAQLDKSPVGSIRESTQVEMFSPFNTPEVQAPLGWALAEPTRRGMRDDVADAIEGYCGTELFRDVGRRAPENGP
jgi:hypothetical protein